MVARQAHDLKDVGSNPAFARLKTKMVKLSNLLAQLRNGYNAHKNIICVESSKDSVKFLNILKQYGLIHGISSIEKNNLKVILKYTTNGNALFSISRVSKPSVKLYFSFRDLWKFHRSYGILIVNTPIGLMCHHEALKAKLGGQVVCYIL